MVLRNVVLLLLSTLCIVLKLLSLIDVFLHALLLLNHDRTFERFYLLQLRPPVCARRSPQLEPLRNRMMIDRNVAEQIAHWDSHHSCNQRRGDVFEFCARSLTDSRSSVADSGCHHSKGV